MAYQKLSGNQVILGGAVILTAPTIYAAGSYNKLATSSTGVFKIYGVPAIENTTPDAKLGGLKKAGLTEYVLKIPFAGTSFATTTLTSAAFDTGKDIPAGAIVTDAWFDIHTVGTSGTIHAGTHLDVNGLLISIPIQVASPVVGTLTATSAGQTYGALFTNTVSPTSAVASAKVNYVATSVAQSVMIGRSATTAGTDALVGDLYVHYMTPATS